MARLTWTSAARLLWVMANAQDKPKPNPIIPPDPDPPDPDRKPPSTRPSKPPAKRTGRDKTRESHPDFGDVRHVPPRTDPPLITSRMSTKFDSSSTYSVGPAAPFGYDLLLIHDRTAAGR